MARHQTWQWSMSLIKNYFIMYKLFFLFIILNISFNYTFSQTKDDTSKVLVKFSEPMSKEGIFDINNYKIITEDNVTLKIFKVGIVQGDTAVVLFTEKHPANKPYKLFITNLKDRSGNLISLNHNTASY